MDIISYEIDGKEYDLMNKIIIDTTTYLLLMNETDPDDLLLRIRLLLIQRDCMENAFLPYSDKYYRPIEKGQKDLTKLFINHPEILDKASLWCDLYHSYEEKVLGDVYGREYKKRREC